MAGSLQRFIYTLDDGTTTIPLTLDESNSLATGATLLGNTTTTGLPGSIIRLKPRYILAVNSTGTIKRKIVVCNPDNALYKSGGTLTLRNYGTGATETFQVSGSVGEKKTFGFGTDTGQNDGTPDATAGP